MLSVSALDLGEPISTRPRFFTTGLVVAKRPVGSHGGIFATNIDRLTGNNLTPVGDGIAALLGNDQRLMRIWHRRATLGMRLKAAGYRTAITPGFSMYWDSPSYDGLVMMRMSTEMSRLLARDVQVVPTVGWRNDRDLERWVEWLEAGHVPIIAVHLSTRADSEWDWMTEGLRFLSARLLQGTRLIAFGVSSASRIRRVAGAWAGPLTIASGKPWASAVHGGLLTADLQEIRASSRMHVEALVRRNTATFLKATARLMTPSLPLVS